MDLRSRQSKGKRISPVEVGMCVGGIAGYFVGQLTGAETICTVSGFLLGLFLGVWITLRRNPGEERPH
ncbi:hypothetical protein KL86CLO1_12344 [uncultured Eubacteriales bacterium]|uniref:Uncharacterized protein n=1 Tax=uncultured Eubacteriales bacterium TaxID=172733 RepID=A0A212K7T1_9FIRM|nr:hypothetical protein KL86CLO1_12344 [uncultured Eubacteriales bacterium]